MPVCVADKKWQKKRNNLKRMRDILTKQFRFGEPTSRLDQICLMSTQREREPILKIAQLGEDLLNLLFSSIMLHGRTCEEVHGKVLRIGKRECNVAPN